MMKVAVIDDEITISQFIAEQIQSCAKINSIQIDIAIFNDSKDFYESFVPGVFDAVFLDLEMPYMSGDELSAKLSVEDPDLLLIYVTNHSDNVYSMLKYMPIGFIRKRHFEEEIEQLVVLLSEKIESRKKIISFTSNKTTYNIKLNTITYIESQKNYCIIFTRTGESFKFRGKLDDIMSNNLNSDFVRIHKSVAVNCKYISAILKSAVLIEGEVELSVSRAYQKELEKKFLLYRRNNVCH